MTSSMPYSPRGHRGLTGTRCATWDGPSDAEIACLPEPDSGYFLHRTLGGGEPMARLTINGKTNEINVDPNTPLLWAIREQVGLTGTKYGCGLAPCGACTVHLGGAAVRSCVMPVSAAEGKKITTIEGLANGGALSKVQKAWLDNEVPQCGYCQSGMIMAVAALLKEKPKPTDADIDAKITNSRRCGTFHQVRQANHAAAKA